MNPLVFRRQFFAIPFKSSEFKSWHVFRNDAMSIYFHVHPDLEFYKVTNRKNAATLLGFILDPEKPESANEKILHKLIEDKNNIEEIFKPLSQLSGRFVLFLSIKDKNYVFHDPMGLRTLVFGKIEGKYCFASDTAILTKHFPLKKAGFYEEFQNSVYKKTEPEHFLPAGLTLYEGFYGLVPNHFLDISREKTIRFWPVDKIEKQDVNAAAKKSAYMLKSLIKAASKRFPLALPLTAGLDSRLLLAASKDYVSDIFVYTLLYRDLELNSEDVHTPDLIAESLGFKHNKIECRIEKDKEFLDVYKKNTSLAHDDWADIANGMHLRFPHKRIILKGCGSEITRCKHYDNKYEKKSKNINKIFKIMPYWKELDFCKRSIEKWFMKSKSETAKTGINIFDLYHWEQKEGSWQSQSQLEWDSVQEAFTPFNYRPLLSTMLGVPVKYRNSTYGYILHQRIAKLLWEDVMKHPVNGKVLIDKEPPNDFLDAIHAIRTYFYRKGLSRSSIQNTIQHLKGK